MKPQGYITLSFLFKLTTANIPTTPKKTPIILANKSLTLNVRQEIKY